MKVKGSVYPSVSGKSIVIDFRYKGKRCKENIKMPPTAENLRDCEKKLASVQTAIAVEEAMGGDKFDYAKHFPDSKKARSAVPTTDSISAALNDWLKKQGKKRKPSVMRGYKLMVRALTDKFGHLSMSGLTVEILEQWVNDQLESRTVKTVRNKLAPLRGALHTAVRYGHITSNPLSKIEKMEAHNWEKTRALRPGEVDPFDLDEIRAILTKGRGPIVHFFKFAIYTGLRIGELFALAWEDIDFVHWTIRIQRARTEKALGTPKTRESVRTLKLKPRAIEALKAMKEITFMRDPIDCGELGQLRFVFINPNTDAPFQQDKTLRRRLWPNMLRLAGVRYRYPSQTRHTFASLGISCGQNIKWLADYMGHKDTNMITKHYGKFLKQAAEAAGNHNDGDSFDKLMEKIG